MRTLPLDLSRAPWATTPLLACLFALGVRAAPQSTESSEPRQGIEISAPKDWVELPAHAVDRGACRTFFCAERELPAKGAARVAHVPTLKVLIFNGAQPVEASSYQEEPFASLDDYLARIHPVPGRIIDRDAVEVPGSKDGSTSLRYEAVFEGLALRMSGLAFELADGRKATVVMEYLDDHARDMRKLVDKALATTELVAEAPPPMPTPPWAADREDFFAQDSAARSTQVRAYAEDVVARVADTPGRGWKPVKSKTWTVFTRESSRDTKRVLEAAESMREWCEQKLPGLGGEVAPAILRIYGSPQELATAQATGIDPRPFDPTTRTLHFAIDPNAGTGEGYGLLLEAVAWQWIDDQIPGALYHTPRWFIYGFNEYFRSTKQGKRGIEFFPDDIEKGRLAWNRENDRMPHLWDLIQEMSQPEPEDGDKEKDGSREWDYTPESSRLMRWFFEHDGSQAMKQENFPVHYLQAVGQALTEVGPNPVPGIIRARVGDDDAAREARATYFTWRKNFRDATNKFGATYDRDLWFAIDKLWLEFVAED